MSTLRRLGMAMLIALVFAGCGSNRASILTKGQLVSDNQAITVKDMDYFIPCRDLSYDDEKNYRALGIGFAFNSRKAIEDAFQDAKKKLSMKISTTRDTVFNANVICEDLRGNESGYTAFCTLEIHKDSIQYQRNKKKQSKN